MKKLLGILLCIALYLSACSNRPSPVINIVPDQCAISAGEEWPISLKGTNIPADAEIKWSATKGKIDPPTGLGVVYTAPQEPGKVVITAEFEAGEIGISTTLHCEITSAEPIPTAMPIVQPTATGDSSAGNATPEVEPGSQPQAYTIAISEVMASPCGGGSGTVPNKNEYIELYNYGSAGVDVMGWWIATNGGGGGTPDKIVPWNFANPGASMGSNYLVNDSVIPPGKFAVILSPMYQFGGGKHHMPYTFPEGTILLSFSSSKYLGNDTTGLVGNNWTLTTIILYMGTESIMSRVISTYGTPTYGLSPNNLVDDKLDNFPYPLEDCRSMERIDAAGPDLISNWQDINMGNPGKGSYDID